MCVWPNTSIHFLHIFWKCSFTTSTLGSRVARRVVCLRRELCYRCPMFILAGRLLSLDLKVWKIGFAMNITWWSHDDHERRSDTLFLLLSDLMSSISASYFYFANSCHVLDTVFVTKQLRITTNNEMYVFMALIQCTVIISHVTGHWSLVCLYSNREYFPRDKSLIINAYVLF